MYEQLKAGFSAAYGNPPEEIFISPVPIEIGGNSEHQNGKVLCGAVNRFTTAASVRRNDSVVRIQLEGYPLYEINCEQSEPVAQEMSSILGLIRGVTSGIYKSCIIPKGFDAYISSPSITGTGLSSIASFEVLIGTILNHYAGNKLSPSEIAGIGQYAQNVYFDRTCGLMHQITCAHGGIISIDFENPDSPNITPIPFNLSSSGYALCIIDSGADQACTTNEYDTIPEELEKVCTLFGAETLREIPEEKFFSKLKSVRRWVGDRAMLRAMHVYAENKRVDHETAALLSGQIDEFLKIVSDSGLSSWTYLQNVIPAGNTNHQELAFTLGLAKQLLNGQGAVRVPGRGFSGGVQAFVPVKIVTEFKNDIEKVLGDGTCHILTFCPNGAKLVEVVS